MSTLHHKDHHEAAAEHHAKAAQHHRKAAERLLLVRACGHVIAGTVKHVSKIWSDGG